MTAKDDEIVRWALKSTNTLALADREMDQLSGGQRQRAWIAMALAQKTGILFLDEPTTYLDISHQLEILQLLRELNVQQGVTVVMVLHDLNHAIMFSDYLVTIKDGKKYLEGSPEEVVTPHMLQEVFDVEAEVIQHPVLHVPVCLPYGVRGQTFAKDMKEVDIPKHRERIERVFTADNALKYVEFAIKAVTNSLPFEEVPKYADAVMLQRYTAVCGHLAYSLEEYQKAMLDFAEQSDGNEADRTAEGFAKMFGTYFPPEFSITEGNAWMSTLNNSVQYVSAIRPSEDVAKLVKRMHYVSFVGMFRSDLFEGLCVGHAPKKCKICGKWFLTTNARHTKYCGGYAPGDKLHRTCRQIGNLKGREQRELADDHPIIQIYEKRLNTINRYVKRGTLDADLAEVMKKLAKDKELRAKSDVAYAKGAYEKEMEQAALLAEAKIHI